MDPEFPLVDRYTLDLPGGWRLEFDQTLWGKVCHLESLSGARGRYFFEDDRETAQVRQLLEATTLFGTWSLAPEAAEMNQLQMAIEALLAKFD